MAQSALTKENASTRGSYHSLVGDVLFKNPGDIFVLNEIMNQVERAGENIYPREKLMSVEVEKTPQQPLISADFKHIFVESDSRLPEIHDNPQSGQANTLYGNLGINTNCGRLTPAEAVAAGTVFGEISILWAATTDTFQREFPPGVSVRLTENIEAAVNQTSGRINAPEKLWPQDFLDGMHTFYDTLLMATRVREWVLQNGKALPSQHSEWATYYRDWWDLFWNRFVNEKPVLTADVIESARKFTRYTLDYYNSPNGMHMKRCQEAGIDQAATMFTQVFQTAIGQGFAVSSPWFYDEAADDLKQLEAGSASNET